MKLKSEFIEQIRKNIKEKPYKQNLIVKEGWEHPLSGDSDSFLIVIGTSRSKPKPYVFDLTFSENGDVSGMSINADKTIQSVKYPFSHGFIPSKEQWIEVGIIYASKLPFFSGDRLEWVDYEKSQINPSIPIPEINISILEAKKRKLYKSNPNVKKDWEYPDLPEGYNIALAMEEGGNITIDFLDVDLSKPHSSFASDHGIDAKGQVVYPWVDGFTPKADDWHAIGFSFGKCYDGMDMEINLEAAGWLA